MEPLEGITGAGETHKRSRRSPAGGSGMHRRVAAVGYFCHRFHPAMALAVWKRWLGPNFQSSAEQVFILEAKLHGVSLARGNLRAESNSGWAEGAEGTR